MGRHCKICSDEGKSRKVTELLAAGATDRAVAEAIGGLDRMAVQRHRTSHMTGRPGRIAQQREEAAQRLAALEMPPTREGSPEQPVEPDIYLSLSSIASDLAGIDRRLTLAANVAAAEGRAAALAQLSAQQLRLAETRARLGEVGGYGRDRGGAGSSSMFSISITISGQQQVVLTAVAEQAVQTQMVDRHPLALGRRSQIFDSAC